ncbi:MAG: hypothetical protein Q8N63_08910 [Nanoarchaeota archaeon]|nr:hypothetical protein [Nanoarchaeota archaeon]
MSEKIQTIVLPREYRETINPMEILVTQDLDSCVGLALVKDFNGLRKRGLTYIASSKDACYDEDIVKLIEEDKKRAVKILEKDLCTFLELKEFPETIENPEKIRVYVIANRIKQEKKKVLNREYIGQINPMFDFTIQWFTKMGIPPTLTDGNAQFKREADKDDKRVYPIMTKEIALHHDKINIIYRNNASVLLNPDSCSHLF